MQESVNVGKDYDVHGAVAIRVVGQGAVADVIGRTLGFFESPPRSPDLTLVLGRYPSREWSPPGTLVGDRILYDRRSGTTTVLNSKAVTSPQRSEVEYVISGDLRTSGEAVTVYIPNVRQPLSPASSFGYDLRRRRMKRAVLDLSGNPYGMQRVVRQAERITESILEPFLFYRLPSKGLSLIHASAICTQGAATLFAGSANVGKSSLALRFVKEGAPFLGDALVILAESGQVLPYPGLVKLHGGHLESFPELATRLTAKMGRVGARLLRSDLSANPNEVLGYLPQLQAAELFEGVTVPKSCTLRTAILLGRASLADAATDAIEPELLARAISANLYWGLEAAPWRNMEFAYAPSAALGRDFFEEATERHAKVDEIIRKGVSKARCYRLTLPFGAPLQGIVDLLHGIGS